MSSPTTQHLSRVWSTAPSDVYAVGDNGTILHYDGTTWSAMSSGTTILDLFSIGGCDVFRYDGRCRHDPSLHTRRRVDLKFSGTVAPLRSVWATAVMTPSSSVMRWPARDGIADGADTGQRDCWTAMTVPTISRSKREARQSLARRRVGLESRVHAWWAFLTSASGTPHGTVLQINTASGNLTWGFTNQSLTPNDLKAVWGVVSSNKTDVFIGGLFGTLLHYTAVPGAKIHFRLYDANTTRGINGPVGSTRPRVPLRAATPGGDIQLFDGTTSVIATDLGIAGKNLVGVYEDVASGVADRGPATAARSCATTTRAGWRRRPSARRT